MALKLGPLWIYHNPLGWPQPSSGRVVIIWPWSCWLPQPLPSAESSNLHKFVQFPILSLNWAVVLLQYKTSVQTWVLPRKGMQNDTKPHTKYHPESSLSTLLFVFYWGRFLAPSLVRRRARMQLGPRISFFCGACISALGLMKSYVHSQLSTDRPQES